MNQIKIVEQLGVNQSTISRELKRNFSDRGNRVKQENNKAIKRQKKALSCTVMTLDTIEYITSKLKEKWSPEQITGRLKSGIEKTIKVSHETIYKFIWEDKKQGYDLYKLLRRKAKKYNSRSREKLAGRGYIMYRIGIEDRRTVVDERTRVGDPEIDLVIGKGHSGAIVTIVERLTR